jgi:ABC-type uncharacterized transport system auxiliary subunit
MKMTLRKLAGMLIAVAAALTVPASAQQPSPALRTITITAPADDDTVHSNVGNVRVAVTVAPRLAANETIVISLDDREAARGTRRHLQLSGIERGTHLLQARLLDAKGNTLAQSDVVTFHLWQASRLFPSQKK